MKNLRKFGRAMNQMPLKMTEQENISNIKSNAAPIPKLEDLRNIYFIGIGGIGMSALARYFKSRGATVSGYDKTSTLLTQDLEASGIAIHYNEDVSSIPKDTDAVVY